MSTDNKDDVVCASIFVSGQFEYLLFMDAVADPPGHPAPNALHVHKEDWKDLKRQRYEEERYPILTAEDMRNLDLGHLSYRGMRVYFDGLRGEPWVAYEERG